MIKLVLYITGFLSSLIAQSLAYGCFYHACKKVNCDDIVPLYNLNDTIKEDLKDISNDNPVNNSEDLSCHFCQQETNSVTFFPCGHISGNYCANKISIGKIDCPFCYGTIDDFENLSSSIG
ncbi:uncharacterized protein LOC126903967 isoform X3 [Daktulosphaira vitifoliae]|uniref:uncharacterized protein LOC126903967 isoform X3 n=1 Tax=Daktulosphaira vitifoliae TaxID=58002 RepID=UPI0021AA882D|nr:uncharacterized protein LOC126903967 isoform X3 [Daktulosphaira vitifoliae]